MPTVTVTFVQATSVLTTFLHIMNSSVVPVPILTQFFGGLHFFGPIFFLTKNFFRPKVFFGPIYFFRPKIFFLFFFGSKDIFSKTFFEIYIFFTSKNFRTLKNICGWWCLLKVILVLILGLGQAEQQLSWP